MQTSLSILGISAALVMCVVSAAMNYLFLSSLGKTPVEGQVLGAASAAADVLKALLPFVIARTWRSRRVVAALLGLIAFLFFAVFSLASAIGFAAENRGVLAQAREHLSSEYNRIQATRERMDVLRNALPAHRSASIVSEEISRHRQAQRWSATRGCTDVTENKSREYCAAYFSLRAEMATAEEADRLAREIENLDAKLAKLQADGAGQVSDPQALLLSRLTGTNENTVQLVLVVAVALLVEIGASLGLFLVSDHNGSKKTTGETKQRFTVGGIEDFSLESLAPSERSLTLDDIYSAYSQWCQECGFSPMAQLEFETSFSELAQLTGIKQSNGVFQSIGLSASVQ